MVAPQRNTAFGQSQATSAAIDAGLRSYMLRVYNYMSLGVAFTAIVALGIAQVPALFNAVALGPLKWVIFAGLLGMGWFAPRLMMGGSVATAQLCFWVYAALWGALISPMLYFYMSADPGIVLRAFLITTATFAGTSLFGYVTKRNLSGFGTFFVMATIGILIAMLVNVFFFQDTGISLLISCAVVLLFSGITAYETQMIKSMYMEGEQGDIQSKKAIFGAFMLYGSFITLFIHILNILGMMRGD